MSSIPKGDFPVGWATLIAGIAVIIAAIIGVAYGRNLDGNPNLNQNAVVVVTATKLPNDASGPQPTYTLLPTYTPYPTFTPNRLVVTQAPFIVTTTSSIDQQNPPPQSIISAGQGFTGNGVTVTLVKSIVYYGDNFGFTLQIGNRRAVPITFTWKNPCVHLRDNKGNLFHQHFESQLPWSEPKAVTIPNGGTFKIDNSCNYQLPNCLDDFNGPIDLTAGYLIIGIDELAGLTNMNWRYDIQ